MTMIEPTLENIDGAPGVILPDGDAFTTITAWIDGDGADDTPAWGHQVLHVQIDTDVDSDLTGYVVHLNDGPPIYQGNPEVHESAAEVLRQVRTAIAETNWDYPDATLHRIDAIIRTSGVIL